MSELPAQAKYRRAILLKAKEMTARQLFLKLRELGWRKDQNPNPAEVRGWKSGKKPIPIDAVEPLARLFSLPYDTVKLVEQEFGGVCWAGVAKGKSDAQLLKKTQGNSPTSFGALLALLEAEQEKLKSSLVADRERFVKLIATLTTFHSVFVTTLTEMPLTFKKEKNEEEEALIQSYYTAITNGAMVCIVIPSAATIASHNNKYAYAKAPAYDDFWNGYGRFRQGLIQHLSEPNVGAKNAEKYADTHLQMLDFEHFPLTPAFWTVSLLGVRTPPRIVQHWTVLRAPERHINGPRLVECTPKFNRAMSDYAESVLEFYLREDRADDTVRKRVSRCDVKGSRLEWRETYLKNFLNRLSGESDGDPIPLEIE